MEIPGINNIIENMGYNSFGINSTGTQEAEELAQINGISTEEAQEILTRAAEEESAMLDLLSTQEEEEELIGLSDVDFDAFLNEDKPESIMQNLYNQQQIARTSRT